MILGRQVCQNYMDWSRTAPVEGTAAAAMHMTFREFVLYMLDCNPKASLSDQLHTLQNLPVWDFSGLCASTPAFGAFYVHR
jgi:hypothetical protein